MSKNKQYTMSKKGDATRNLIVKRTLDMFNERGVEYVGLREIAADLGMRVSNITYYFPTKDDLVNQLTLDLNKLNEVIFGEERVDMTMIKFFESLQKVFLNQIRYKGIMISMVHIMENNKIISKRHKVVQQKRNSVIHGYLKALCLNGYLRIENDSDFEKLTATISMIARFWISESVISYKKLELSHQLKFNLSLIANLLEPYSSKKAKAQNIQFFNTLTIE